jgi:DNA-binding FrmR family transcriptional regulator
MKTPHARIKNVIGQLEAVARMMEDGKRCDDVIVQLKAAKSALTSATSAYVEAEAQSCIDTSKNTKQAHAKLGKLIRELAK